MFKKILAIMLVLVTFAAMLVSCDTPKDGKKCPDGKHSYGSTYAYDDKHHWISCNKCSQKKNHGTHDFSNGITCSVCSSTKKIDLGGYEYKAYVSFHSMGGGAFYVEDFWVDPKYEGRDTLDFAVIQRNQQIELDYNCKIKQILSTYRSQFTEMGVFFKENQKFELAILRATDAASCATAGYLSNIKSDFNNQYIDTTSPAFDQNSVKDLTVGDALYYISGDMNISAMDNTISTVFNTDEYQLIAEEMALTFGDAFASPYTMVEEGKWTIENMLKIANEYTYDDNDSDGPLAYDKGDQIGYFEYQATPVYYYYGGGFRITENVDGYPQFTINTPAAEEAYDYLYENLNVRLNPNIINGASGDRIKNFKAGAVLFTDSFLWDVRLVLYRADIDFVYGILPVPTMDENAEHHSVVLFQNVAVLWSLPVKRENAQKSSIMMSVMAEYSAMPGSTMDAYYVCTTSKNAPATDKSIDSLKRIRNSLVYDIALIYNQNGQWGNFERMLNNIDTATEKEFEKYTSAEKMQLANEQMAETIRQFVQYGAD